MSFRVLQWGGCQGAHLLSHRGYKIQSDRARPDTQAADNLFTPSMSLTMLAFSQLLPQKAEPCAVTVN